MPIVTSRPKKKVLPGAGGGLGSSRARCTPRRYRRTLPDNFTPALLGCPPAVDVVVVWTQCADWCYLGCNHHSLCFPAHRVVHRSGKSPLVKKGGSWKVSLAAHTCHFRQSPRTEPSPPRTAAGPCGAIRTTDRRKGLRLGRCTRIRDTRVDRRLIASGARLLRER